MKTIEEQNLLNQLQEEINCSNQRLMKMLKMTPEEFYPFQQKFQDDLEKAVMEKMDEDFKNFAPVSKKMII